MSDKKITAQCPSCLRGYQVREIFRGKRFKCEDCGGIVKIGEEVDEKAPLTDTALILAASSSQGPDTAQFLSDKKKKKSPPRPPSTLEGDGATGSMALSQRERGEEETVLKKEPSPSPEEKTSPSIDGSDKKAKKEKEKKKKKAKRPRKKREKPTAGLHSPKTGELSLKKEGEDELLFWGRMIFIGAIVLAFLSAIPQNYSRAQVMSIQGEIRSLTSTHDRPEAPEAPERPDKMTSEAMKEYRKKQETYKKSAAYKDYQEELKEWKEDYKARKKEAKPLRKELKRKRISLLYVKGSFFFRILAGLGMLAGMALIFLKGDRWEKIGGLIALALLSSHIFKLKLGLSSFLF